MESWWEANGKYVLGDYDYGYKVCSIDFNSDSPLTDEQKSKIVAELKDLITKELNSNA